LISGQDAFRHKTQFCGGHLELNARFASVQGLFIVAISTCLSKGQDISGGPVLNENCLSYAIYILLLSTGNPPPRQIVLKPRHGKVSTQTSVKRSVGGRGGGVVPTYNCMVHIVADQSLSTSFNIYSLPSI